MLKFINIFLFILIFIQFWCSFVCFNVHFREGYNIKVEPFNTHIFKRDLAQFFDKASYSFNGLEKIESVPVHFPIDICFMKLEDVKYATSLHIGKNGVRHFAVFKMNNGNYVLITDIPTPLAIAMDCKAIGAKGYVAIAYNITASIMNAQQGSPIYEIAGDRLRAVQYFAATNLVSVYLRVTGNDFFLLQTFRNTQATPNLRCPYYIWSGSTFNKIGYIPCSNARHLEPFSIDYESYVAVANYADQHGRTATNSEIYKYVREKRQFQLFQKIKTNGAVDVRYFSVPFDEVKRQHFLIFGNSISTAKASTTAERNLEADSIFYVFDKGQFVPYQRLSFYAVEKFLPVQNTDAEKFLLLVAGANQDIKIYNLNDWKFEESEAQFTEGAFGRGVANMRIYQESENSYLVIANELMNVNETNVFLPIFKQDEHANALRQQIIDWAKSQKERLAGIDVEKLKEDVNVKMALQQKNKFTVNTTVITNTNIQTVTTKTLLYPRLHMTKNYWKALSYANQALDALQSQFATRKRGKRELDENYVYEFENMRVRTLSIQHKLQANRVNGIETTQPQLENITAKEVITGSYQAHSTLPEKLRISANANDAEGSADIINVENVHVTGKLNEYMWDHMTRSTLKRTGQQFLKAPVSIGSLHAETVVTTNEEVNGRNLGKLISINGGKYVVQQDVQFAAPITAKKIVINERLNNIHIHQHKFDVLLKQSNETQVLEGAKRFDVIRVLEPITIAGRMLGRQLRAIAPNKAVHDDLQLHGDYIISGDVTISQLLTTNDIVEANSNISVKAVLQNSIRLDKQLEDLNIMFTKPLEVNNSLVSFINALDLQHLVKTHVDAVQVIDGEKVFRNGLDVNQGFIEVKHLNGYDIEVVEKRLLLKHINQTVHVPMQFGKILAKGIQAPNVTLSGKKLTEYLTRSDSQQMKGALKVHKLTTQTLQLENLNINGRIFNASLAAIYQQKSKFSPKSEIFQNKGKFHGSIYVKNVFVNASINGEQVTEIERQLALLHGNIKYVGNFKFNYDMNIINLTFHGALNGIPAADFGHCWLQKTGEQHFVAPQTLAEVTFQQGVLLQGKLNGRKVDDFFNDVLWINRNEYIKNAIFQNPIQMQAVLRSHTVNGIYIPQDMLYRSSAYPQLLYADACVQQDLLIGGDILNTSTINGINLLTFKHYLSAADSSTLHVEHANFGRVPHFKSLNQHNLGKTLDDIWLANENVDLQHHIEISEGYFEGLLEFQGPINNMNLHYLQENYLSLSRPQTIDVEIVFSNALKFANDVNIEDLHLLGPIVDSKSNSRFCFNEFVSFTLKTSGPHAISGHWRLREASIEGSLYGVQVNNLNLAQDVLRADAPFSEIAALKRISAAVIRKFYATPTSVLNGLEVTSWIRDAVYVYDNYTIRGTTTLDAVNLNNDLRVHGRVNNFAFNENTILLRSRDDQILRSTVRVHNKFPLEKRVLTNNFEYLQSVRINGINLSKFFGNQAKLGTTTTAQVASHLVFSQPLLVEEYHGVVGGVYNAMKWKRGTSDDDLMEHWQMLELVVHNMKKSFEVPYFILDHFEIRQTILMNASDIIPLMLRLEHEFLDVIGIFNQSGNDEILQFYRWDKNSQQFAPDEILSWLPKGKLLVDLMKLVFDYADYLSIEKPPKFVLYHNIIGNDTQEDLREVLQLKQAQKSKISSFEMGRQDCFALHGNNVGEGMPIYCLELMQKDEKSLLKIHQKSSIPRANVKQIMSLNSVQVAFLCSDAIEIWHTDNTNLKLAQRLPLVRPKQASVATRNGITYISVISHIRPNTLHHGTIEIYSAVNGSHFEHMQTLDLIEPQQIAFTVLKRSDDLLLHVLTSTADQPLIVYQYRGVVGFEQIIGASTLPAAERMQIIELKETKQNLVALLGRKQITFVEIVLKRF